MPGIDFDTIVASKCSTPDALLQGLQQAGCQIVTNKKIKCVWHDDNNPSAGVYEKNGKWQYKCMSCGHHADYFDVAAHNNNTDRLTEIKKHIHDEKPVQVQQSGDSQAKKPKVWPDAKAIFDWVSGKAKQEGGTVTPYRYTNPTTGGDDLVVIRIDYIDGRSKEFRQCSPCEGGWVMRLSDGKLPLYNRTGISSADSVVIVEGEKAAKALIEIGICATTPPGGANKAASDVDWSPLEGKKVYLWRDNDKAGAEHMQDVAQVIDRMATIHQVDPSRFDLGEKEDAYEAVNRLKEQGLRDDQVLKHVKLTLLDAPSNSPSDEVSSYIEDQISGKWQAVPFEWPSLSRLTRAMLPGTVTVICGDPNDGKSFFLLQCAGYWLHQEKVSVALYELEDDKRYHLMRSLAQTHGDSRLLDDKWVKENPDDAREAFALRAEQLDGLGRSMWDSPDSVVKLSDLTEWVRERCKEGYRIIAIDPITATSTGDSRFQDDLDFVINIKILARKYGASIILITHPKKGRKNSYGLDELAGGAAYSRFTHSVLWIKRHDQPINVMAAKDSLLNIDVGEQVRINRTMYLSKVRNGSGAGLALGYYFDPSTLRFAEQGVIIEAKKEDKK